MTDKKTDFNNKLKQEIIDEIHQLIPTSKVDIVKVQHGLMFNVQQPVKVNIIMVYDGDDLQTPFLTIKTNDRQVQTRLNHWCHENQDINSWYFM